MLQECCNDLEKGIIEIFKGSFEFKINDVNEIGSLIDNNIKEFTKNLGLIIFNSNKSVKNNIKKDSVKYFINEIDNKNLSDFIENKNRNSCEQKFRKPL